LSQKVIFFCSRYSIFSLSTLNFIDVDEFRSYLSKHLFSKLSKTYEIKLYDVETKTEMH